MKGQSTLPTAPVNVRIPAANLEKLARIAEYQDRDRSYVINEAVSRYIEMYECQAALIAARAEELDTGKAELVDHEKAVAHIASLIKKARNR